MFCCEKVTSFRREHMLFFADTYNIASLIQEEMPDVI